MIKRDLKAVGRKRKNFKTGKYFEPGSDRLGNLINKDDVFGKIILIPEILAAAYEVIKDDIKISGLNFRNPKKILVGKHIILIFFQEKIMTIITQE